MTGGTYGRYDTAHVVFRPKHMTPEELAHGYAWLYQRLFSHASIWRRRPTDRRAVPPYLAMSYLYKRSNPIWHWLIQARLTRAVWLPLVEWTRQRHLSFCKRLAFIPSPVPRRTGARKRARRAGALGRAALGLGPRRWLAAARARIRRDRRR